MGDKRSIECGIVLGGQILLDCSNQLKSIVSRTMYGKLLHACVFAFIYLAAGNFTCRRLYVLPTLRTKVWQE